MPAAKYPLIVNVKLYDALKKQREKGIMNLIERKNNNDFMYLIINLFLLNL